MDVRELSSCLLLSHRLAALESVEIEVPVKTGAHVHRVLHEDHSLPRGLSLSGLMAELDGRCSSDKAVLTTP